MQWDIKAILRPSAAFLLVVAAALGVMDMSNGHWEGAVLSGTAVALLLRLAGWRWRGMS